MADEKERKLDAIRSDIAERSSDDPDEYTRKEQNELNARATKPAYRAEVLQLKLLGSLNERINVLQAKLDLREMDYHKLLP